MSNSRLVITDGTALGTINLLDLHGWLLNNWSPAVPEPKGGGVFRGSPLVDGRRLSSRKVDNVIDTFNLVGQGQNQNDMIYAIQELQRLLEKAIQYWITTWSNNMVWIEAQSSCESQIRYAVIVDYRLTGFGGPYQQPFFGDTSTTEAILAIEHLPWQETEPGHEGTCVQASSTVEAPEMAVESSGTYLPAQLSDDVDVNIPEKHVADLSNVTLYIGNVGGDMTESGILFSNVTIPKGAIITEAYIRLMAVSNFGSEKSIKCHVFFESTADPTTFTGTWADYYYRSGWAFPSEDWTMVRSNWTAGSTQDSPSLVQSLQAKVNLSNWVSGNNIVVKLQPVTLPGNTYLTFAAFNHPTYSQARLCVKWTAAATITVLGRTATCDQEVYVGNKHNKGKITHAYWYDASMGTYSVANLVTDTGYPVSLLPVTPEVGDYLYIGSSEDIVDYGPFSSVVFDIVAGIDGLEMEWMYHTGIAAWSTLHGHTKNLCGNFDFSGAGVSAMTFNQPYGWTAYTVDALGHNVTGLWIRGEVKASSGAGVTPQQQHRPIYTINNPYLDIDAAQVGGDIPALSRIVYDGIGCEGYDPSWNYIIYGTDIATLIVGLRSLTRGQDFTAYLNCSSLQTFPGIQFTPYPDYSLLADTGTPTGQWLNISTLDSASLTEVGSWSFSNQVALEYSGVYHAYLRVNIVGAGGFGACTAKFRIRCLYGDGYNVSYSDTVTVERVEDLAVIRVADLGQLVINPPSLLGTAGNAEFSLYPSGMRIILDASCDDTPDYLDVMDLILIPADEWLGVFSTVPDDDDTITISNGKKLDINGITNPKSYNALIEATKVFNHLGNIETITTIVAETSRVASSPPVLQSNASQRLWFFGTRINRVMQPYNLYDAPIGTGGKVKIQRSNRYLLMRGNR